MSDNPFNKYNEIEVSKKITDSVIHTSKQVMNPDIGGVALKYVLLFSSSILFSLIICPQRGVGFLRDSYPLFHHLLHQSEVLCGLYCGFTFFVTTHVLSFFILTHFERLVVVRRVSYLPMFLMTLFFGLSMTSFFSNLELSTSYFTSWFIVVTIGYMSLTFYYRNSYTKAV